MANTKLIRVYYKDVYRLRTHIKKLLIEENPELDGMRITDAYMIHRLIDHGLGVNND